MGNMIPHGDRLHECTPGCPEYVETEANIAMEMVKAPWTEAQVANANEFQLAGMMHPFTCTTNSATLVATPEGWVCPTCDYKQDWAYRGMLDGSILLTLEDSFRLDAGLLREISDVPDHITSDTEQGDRNDDDLDIAAWNRISDEALRREALRRQAERNPWVSVVIAIGNSDDRLTQADWALFYERVDTWVENCEDGNFIKVHGRWHSLPNAAYQNAAWSFMIHPARAEQAQHELAALARTFDQDSIAWTQGETTFVMGRTHA